MGSCISSSIHKNQTSAKIKMSTLHNIPPTPIKDKPTNVVNNNVDPPFISHSFKSKVSPLNSLSSYRSHGSREEAFYDTQGWLDSDCEDDFHSVNGDFTPSRGNTPVHPSTGTSRFNKAFSPQVNKALFDGRLPLNSASLRSQGNTSVRRSFSSIPEATGTLPNGVVGTSQDTALKPKKKRLADLFRESMRERGGIGLSFPGYESDASPKRSTSPKNTALPSNSKTGNSPLSAPRNMPENYVLQKDKSSKFSHRCFPKLVHTRKL